MTRGFFMWSILQFHNFTRISNFANPDIYAQTASYRHTHISVVPLYYTDTTMLKRRRVWVLDYDDNNNNNNTSNT